MQRTLTAESADTETDSSFCRSRYYRGAQGIILCSVAAMDILWISTRFKSPMFEPLDKPQDLVSEL